MKLTCAGCNSTLEETVDRIAYTIQIMEQWAKIHAPCMEAALVSQSHLVKRIEVLERWSHPPVPVFRSGPGPT